MGEVSPKSYFEVLVQSDLFTFYIGPEKKPFVVHSEAVAATSEYFDALVNGDMVEAKTRSAEFQDVKPEDFARFLEYAYRHDYAIPPYYEDEDAKPPTPEPPVPLKSEQVPMTVEDETVPEPPVDDWGVPGRKTVVKKRKKPKPTLRSSLEKRNYLTTGDPKAELLQSFEPHSNSSPQQDFTPVFLAHARLYTFADMRLVQPLRDLALHKLHKTLMGFWLFDRRVRDVLELARYAYDQGSDRTSEGAIDDLRELVVEYIAGELNTIGKHKDFTQLMEEGGEFVGDFWNIMQKRLLPQLQGVDGWAI